MASCYCKDLHNRLIAPYDITRHDNLYAKYHDPSSSGSTDILFIWYFKGYMLVLKGE